MNPQFTAQTRHIIGRNAHSSSQSSQHRAAQPPLSFSTPHHHRAHGLLQRQHSDDSESQSSARRRRHEQQHHHGPQHVRSKSIPIHPSCGGEMKRTPSEQQLHEDEAMADYRDMVMFRRIAEGIRRQQRDTTHRHPRMVNELCLASIIDTRNLTEDELVLRSEEDRFDDDDDDKRNPSKRNGNHHQPYNSTHHRHIHRNARTTSYLDPSTCKWIIATHPHHDHEPQHRRFSPAMAAATAGLGVSDARSSPSASADDEMLFPLEL
jgi:hypothetical protein